MYLPSCLKRLEPYIRPILDTDDFKAGIDIFISTNHRETESQVLLSHLKESSIYLLLTTRKGHWRPTRITTTLFRIWRSVCGAKLWLHIPPISDSWRIRTWNNVINSIDTELYNCSTVVLFFFYVQDSNSDVSLFICIFSKNYGIDCCPLSKPFISIILETLITQ
jgi:hypothetical protein